MALGKGGTVAEDRWIGPIHKQALARLWWGAEIFRDGADYAPVERAFIRQDLINSYLHRPLVRCRSFALGMLNVFSTPEGKRFFAKRQRSGPVLELCTAGSPPEARVDFQTGRHGCPASLGRRGPAGVDGDWRNLPFGPAAVDTTELSIRRGTALAAHGMELAGLTPIDRTVSMTDRTLRVGEAYRYSKDAHPEEKIDGLPNFHFKTSESATGKSGKRDLPDRDVRAGYLLATGHLPSNHTLESRNQATPWHDVFDLETGRAIYFGDHKVRPSLSALLVAIERCERPGLYIAEPSNDRLFAPPVLAFRAVDRTTARGTIEHKGAVEYLGVAVITNATEIDATDPITENHYENMMFELELLTLPNGGTLDWSWINARRTSMVESESTLDLAPSSWRAWVSTSSTT